METTYVLMPGAGHGAWAWRPVAERLRASGHRAVALMHRPGTKFASWLGVEPVMVPGSHESLLTHPDSVAKAILAA